MCLSYNLATVSRETIINNSVNVLDTCKDYMVPFDGLPKLIFSGLFKKGIVTYFPKKESFPNIPRIGYKVYEEQDGSIDGIFAHNMKMNKWLTSDSGTIVSSYGPSYLNGFHILWNREMARHYKEENGDYSSKIYKVLYKDVVALGLDSGRQVVIAKKMKIIGRA